MLKVEVPTEKRAWKLNSENQIFSTSFEKLTTFFRQSEIHTQLVNSDWFSISLMFIRNENSCNPADYQKFSTLWNSIKTFKFNIFSKPNSFWSFINIQKDNSAFPNNLNLNCAPLNNVQDTAIWVRSILLS